MSDRWSRRQVLATLGASSLAGCGTLDSESRSPLPVEITNFTTESRLLDVQIIRWDAEDRSEATVLRESYELEPSEGDGQNYTVPGVPTVPNQRYLVRASLGGTEIPTRHYHYVPDCMGSEVQDDRLYVWVERGENVPTVAFDQNGCQ